MQFGKTTPILRIFDEAKAREFYADLLGFGVDRQHRFEPGLPIYMQVSKDGCIIHLSEHDGDCCPGAALRIETNALDDFQRELRAKSYRYARPGIEPMPWGSRDMSIANLFGSRSKIHRSDQCMNPTRRVWRRTVAGMSRPYIERPVFESWMKRR